MDFKSYLLTSALEINQEMDNFFEKWSEEVESTSPKLSALNKSFIQACEGGKRIRGTLVKLGYEIARDSIASLQNDKFTKEILKPAVAFEIFQTAILAHDDIIDKSDLRRGVPTIWKKLGGDHYGFSQTICLGDIGFFLAYKLIAESDFSDKEKNLAIQFFSQAMLNTGLGQMLDIELPHQQKIASEEDILTIFRLKTAMYTIIGPMQLGAILGGSDENILKNIETFGNSLGIAFQIQDDILGIFGDEKTLGKSVTSDIEEGKLTLLILYAQQNANKEQKEILEKYYGVGKIGNKEMDLIRNIFINTGALDYSQKKAEKLILEAKKIIPLITKDFEKTKLLEEMADFLVKREK